MAGEEEPTISNRFGFLSGQGVATKGEREAYVKGQLVSGSVRLGYMMGRGAVPSPSYREGFICASGSGSFDYRGGYINGLDVSFSDRYGYLLGQESGSGSRGGYICGWSSGSSYRGGYIDGYEIPTSDRYGYLRGMSSGSSDRYGWAYGAGSGSGSSVGGYISGSFYPYTHQEFTSTVMDLGEDYTDYKWYYDWFVVTRGDTTYTVYVRSANSSAGVDSVPWEEVEIGHRIPRNKLRRYHKYKFRVRAGRAYYFMLHQFTIKAIPYPAGVIPAEPEEMQQEE